MARAQRDEFSSPKWNDEIQQFEMKIGYYLLTPKGAKIERANGRFVGWKRDRKRFRFGQDHRAAEAFSLRKQKEWAELKER